MLEARGITKLYHKNGRTVTAARNLDLAAAPGEMVVVCGPSGSGKSTLLLMLGGMLAPSEGKVLYGDDDLYALSAARRNRYRKRHVGFVFQRFFLVPYLTTTQRDQFTFPQALEAFGDKCSIYSFQ